MNTRATPVTTPAEIPYERIFTKAKPLEEPVATYTISARGKNPSMPIFAYLRNQYGNISLGEIESVFGFVEPCSLYGGRGFSQRELSDRDALQLNNAGIGLRIPMSNHFAEREEYDECQALLEKYHRKGNSIITTNDDLARWIRHDYPNYSLDASVIKNIKTHKKIDEALELYDSVVLPMRINEDLEFLEKVEQKDRIILFANAGCALTCPSKLCYLSISHINKFNGGEFQCSQPIKKRQLMGMVDFPLQPYIDLGYSKFKLLRSRPGGMTGF